jgi:hypothetical protein
VVWEEIERSIAEAGWELEGDFSDPLVVGNASATFLETGL